MPRNPAPPDRTPFGAAERKYCKTEEDWFHSYPHDDNINEFLRELVLRRREKFKREWESKMSAAFMKRKSKRKL